MNTRILAVITTALSVALLVMLLWFKDDPTTAPEDSQLWRQKVAQRDEVIKIKDSIIYATRAVRQDEILKHKKDSTILSNQATRNFKRYSEARELVVELQDSTGRISGYVSAADSLLLAKDSLYHQEVGHRIALEALHATEMAALASKNVQQVAINQEYAARVGQLETKTARLERRLEHKRKGTRIWAGIALGLGAAIGVMGATQ